MDKHSKLDAQNPPFWDREKLKSLFCGLVAGLSSRTLVAPFERAIIIKQTNLSQYSGNTFTLLANIYAKEGLPGFFRGNAANCFRVAPTTAIEFFLFDIFKKQIEPYDKPEFYNTLLDLRRSLWRHRLCLGLPNRCGEDHALPRTVSKQIGISDFHRFAEGERSTQFVQRAFCDRHGIVGIILRESRRTPD
jgi:hypothetical protein